MTSSTPQAKALKKGIGFQHCFSLLLSVRDDKLAGSKNTRELKKGTAASLVKTLVIIMLSLSKHMSGK